jgi:hypothetical protein
MLVSLSHLILTKADLWCFPVLAIRALFKTRRQYSQVLSGAESDLNMTRYFRLMALAVIEVFLKFPSTLFAAVYTFSASQIRPWVSWADTHQYSSQVRVYSYEVFSAQPGDKRIFNLSLWSTVGDAFLFFMFFGLSSEARQDYKQIFSRIATLLGIKPTAPKPQNSVRYVHLATLQGCAQVFTILLDKSSTGPGGVTSSTERTTSDDLCPSASAGDQPSPPQIEQDTIVLQGDLESQSQ